MNEVLQNAIETVDGARQHKCELEGRLGQLNDCISQVSITSEKAREDIKQHFAELQSKIVKEIQHKSKVLLDQINAIEKESLKPLEECKQILDDGIKETVSVIENGEKLLHSEDDTANNANIKKLNKFTNSATGLSLESVPEVPSVTEVACLSFNYKEKNFSQELCSAIKNHGEISKQAPVQITELEPLPGGMVVTWDEAGDDSEVADWIENGNTVLYKLQFCHGKVSLLTKRSETEYSSHFFQDTYIGKNISHTVQKLSPNTVYTFRVSRCLIKGDTDSDLSETKNNWSPWSVYQGGITTLPGYEWADVKDNEGYNVQDKFRVASKRSNTSQILYSKAGGYTVGYPILFRIENEGKSQSLGDGFALVAKIDPVSRSIVKDGSLCVAADGRIFINGTESKTRFSNFCRNMKIRFQTQEIQTEIDSISPGKKSKGKSSVTLRVTITVMDKEAVFNWRIAPSSVLSTNSSNKYCLGFAAAFKSQGWKFSVI
uniref:cytokine receptor-like factor 3 n=1 Tax=Styela clava TaxID=7725 RepID=UPI00193AA858|nr:cytokine receptor-like factor 3 [Styela clava]